MTTISNSNVAGNFLAAKPQFPNFEELRSLGLEWLEKNALPVTKDEEYKFTNISFKLSKVLSNFNPSSPIKLNADMVFQSLEKGYEGDYLVFNNGRFEQSLSKISDEKISIQLLSESSSDLLGKIALTEKDPFVALNNVYMDDGIHILVPKNTVVEKPIRFIFFSQSVDGQVISPRILIQVGDHAAVNFQEVSISLDDQPYFCNTVTEIKVGQNAQVHFDRLQNESRQAVAVNNFVTDIHRDARFTTSVVSLSGDMLRNNLSLNLLDLGCEGNMYGLYLLNGKTHVDNHTNVDHTKPHADSNELYKGILADSSRAVFNGKIFVRQDAQKTNAFQQNNNILLSENAIINTKPQLEIWADDVKCSHGCTTGQLDEEALFYLQARGLGKDQAKGLLLYAFAGEVLENIQDEGFRNLIISMVEERLGSKF